MLEYTTSRISGWYNNMREEWPSGYGIRLESVREQSLAGSSPVSSARLMVVSNILILLFTVASYFFGAKAIVENRYRPNLFSRIIWLLVALNGLASVILLRNSPSIILFAVLGFLGSFLIFVLSLKKSKASFGIIELISTVLLLLSLATWFFARIPFFNLAIGLIITFIGGIPTYIKALRDPYDEDIPFWLFFCVSVIGYILQFRPIDTIWISISTLFSYYKRWYDTIMFAKICESG